MKCFWLFILFLVNILQVNATGKFETAKEIDTSVVVIEDFFKQIDVFLSKEQINQFKALPKDIAVIRLVYRKGDFLKDKWSLGNSFNFFGELKLIDPKPNYSRFFYANKITEPDVMLRVILRCYHNHINNLPVDIWNETTYYLLIPGIESLETTSYDARDKVNRVLFAYEVEIMKFKNPQLAVGDIIGTKSYNSANYSSCYFTGKVVRIDPKMDAIEMSIFDIACSDKKTINSYNGFPVNNGDTLSIPYEKCVVLNFFPFEYYDRTKYWRNYIYEKYFNGNL